MTFLGCFFKAIVEQFSCDLCGHCFSASSNNTNPQDSYRYELRMLEYFRLRFCESFE